MKKPKIKVTYPKLSENESKSIDSLLDNGWVYYTTATIHHNSGVLKKVLSERKKK